MCHGRPGNGQPFQKTGKIKKSLLKRQAFFVAQLIFLKKNDFQRFGKK
jgi:hypothetical protein